jgi:hypothetical protein
VTTLPLMMFTAGLAGNYQIAANTALILLVPSIAFMLLIERFLNTEMLAIGERQSLDAFAAADQWRRAAGNRADKMVELAAVRFGVALEKEMHRLVAGDPIGSGKGDRAFSRGSRRCGPRRTGKN